MKYRRLGKAGVRVSELSFGSWVTFGDQISDDVAEALMIKAYDAGINFFDNAEGYGLFPVKSFGARPATLKNRTKMV